MNRRVSSIVRWVRIHPRLVDAVLAIVVAGLSLAGLPLTLPVMEYQGVAVTSSLLPILAAVVTVQCVPLLLWRIRPVLSFVMAELSQLVMIFVVPQVQFQGLPPLIIAYSLGTRLPPARATLAVAAAILAETITGAFLAVTRGDPILGSAVSRILTTGPTLLLPMVLGAMAVARANNVRLSGERALLERERQVDDAVAEERRRIAGELHDVAAHHLSGMVVQAAAIRRMVDRDPDAAKAGAAQLRVQGKETLNGLRSVVGLLRSAGDIAPVAGLHDLPDLIASTRSLGTDASFRSSGEMPKLAPVVDAAVYRIAQQALSNALQHAPGAAVEVVLKSTPEELTMEIKNRPARQRRESGYRSGGTGTVVMRERASLIGAELEIGPTQTQEWHVLLRLPLAPTGGTIR